MLVAETRTRAYLASLVPIIVNTVLNEHQLVLDIVAFVALGDFPRSRLGEKQRGKILGNWVSRSPKMRTIAQFSIRDPEAEGSVGTVVPEEGMGKRTSAETGRGGVGSLQRGPSSSLTHAESLTSMPVAEELEGEQWAEPPELPGQSELSESRSDLTPTNERPHLNTDFDYLPAEPQSFDPPGGETDQRYIAYRYHDQDTHDSPDSEDYSQYADGRRESGITFPYMDDILDSYGGKRSLRVANRTDSNESDYWEQDALQSLNIRR